MWNGVQPPLFTHPKAPYGYTASGNVRRAPTKTQQKMLEVKEGAQIHAAQPIALTGGAANTPLGQLAMITTDDNDVEMQDMEGSS